MTRRLKHTASTLLPIYSLFLNSSKSLADPRDFKIYGFTRGCKNSRVRGLGIFTHTFAHDLPNIFLFNSLSGWIFISILQLLTDLKNGIPDWKSGKKKFHAFLREKSLRFEIKKGKKDVIKSLYCTSETNNNVSRDYYNWKSITRKYFVFTVQASFCRANFFRSGFWFLIYSVTNL